MEERRRLFIGGAWTGPSGDDVIEVISPHTEKPIAAVAAAGPADVDRAVSAARLAQDEGPWPRLDPSERIATVRRLAELYRPRRREMAQLITAEMGSPISFSKFSQATLPMMLLDAFADIASSFPWEEVRPGFFGEDVLVRRESGGVVAAIVPWNVPLFLVVGKLAPALLAGCSIVVKPAPETPLDSLLFAEVIEEAGLPPGLVSILPGDGTVGEALVNHPGVDRVSFTGSTAVGRRIAAACGASLKKVSLELGGKSAAIVLDDADPATVAQGVKRRRPDEQRPGVRRADAHPRAGGAPRRVPRRARRDGREPRRRGPRRPRDRDRAPGGPSAAGAGPLLHRGRSARGRPPGDRRQRSARGHRVRVVRPAHALRRRRQRDEDRAGGDLRAGPDGDPVSRRRRSRPHCERLRLRALGLGLDGRRRPGPRGRPPRPIGLLRRQPALQHGPRRSLRRREGQRDRPRAGPRGSRGVRRSQGHLGRTANGTRVAL